MENNETATIEGVMGVRTSEKALCCRFDSDGRDHWIPFSQIQADSQVRNIGDRGALVISKWLYDQAQLFSGGESSAHDRTTKGSRPARKPLANRPGTGILFSRGEDGAKPTHSGGINIDGREYQLAGWLKESKSGVRYLSLKVDTGQGSQAAGAPRDDEDIPF